ncbi:nadh:flavin oxidoreductase nadh oxidase [Venturia nashicola]|uniref:Nadh:flavin oxidoreductase nadh oxidase n=1 Tax=Venturia nashicola TaxID=86259 RepID=A0A4Z1NRY8_9PEZI|nr:nadh:flavin oxidoreductase nadh oxidase [Venturia nashicola]TLD18909.1 nadh:flavin oxidoreductase nadh oxidase [Venturia nashicola]
MPSTAPMAKLFSPLSIADGNINLSHRVVMAPMTRNRGIPLKESTPEEPNRIWLADDLVAEYYEQRASKGGLIITEGIPPSLEAGAMPDVPGLFHHSQVAGWKGVVDGVHAKGGFIYAQLWHAGRAAIPQMSGLPTVSASATPWEDDEKYPFRTPFTKEKIAYRDFPPKEMSIQDIKRTIADYVAAATLAMEIGFDGIEVNGGNGNLPDQFLHSNINKRTDAYGGTPEKRCKFILDLVLSLASAIGAAQIGVRLEPCGLYNHTRGTERVETWTHLCRELKKAHRLSYVHFIEPRFDRIDSEKEKEGFYASWSLPKVSNEVFRKAMGDTPCISAGGWEDHNCVNAVEEGHYDALAFAKWFASNPDLPIRLKNEYPLEPYDRSRFYGGWDGRPKGYVDYPFWEMSSLNPKFSDAKKRKMSETGSARNHASEDKTVTTEEEAGEPKKRKVNGTAN